jgi:adenylate cyclase
MAGKRLDQFLRYVVEQTLNGHSGSINQYTIALEAFGHGADFDPLSNPAVRILAQRLRRALDQYYLSQGSEDLIRIDIPKGSYVPIFLYNQVTSQAPGYCECPSPVSAQTPLNSLEDPAIAVVMFENLNGKDEDSYLAKGLTAEILNSLTRFSGLSVLGPLVQAEDKAPDFFTISREYGARFVLQGWVRSQGSKVRITVDLTDASTGNKLWSQTFEYDLEKASLFEIEDEVTSRVVGVVADDQGIVFRRLQTETYQTHIKFNDVTRAVLKYHNAMMTHAPPDFESALVAVNDALDKQPGNALLVALLANIYYGDVLHELKLVPDSLSKMEALAKKAVSLDPDLQLARYNLVPINAFFGRVQECIEEARKVVEMNPNHARIIATCAVHTTAVGAYEMGMKLIERAKRLNPHYPSWYHFVTYLVYFRNEQYEAAWIEVQKIHVEGLLWHPLFRASVLGKLGRVKEAKAYIDELLQIKPEFPKRTREYIKLLFVLDEHVEMIWDGLYKAGMSELE